ncbi:MAG: HAD family hydrolase [Candidatus Woesearchaeota archaeon]
MLLKPLKRTTFFNLAASREVMTKKMLIIDLDGALVKSRPFDMAHQEWFRIMAELLRDQTITQHAFKENYYEQVHHVMKQYLGDISESSRNMFARNMYGMCLVEIIKKWDVYEPFAEYLHAIKKKYLLILITTTPAIAVDALLEKIHCKDLFDVIIKGPLDKEPHKKELFELFLKKYGKPEFYIGKGDKSIEVCKDLGIKTITVSWIAEGTHKGNFEAKTVEDVEKILERYRIE